MILFSPLNKLFRSRVDSRMSLEKHQRETFFLFSIAFHALHSLHRVENSSHEGKKTHSPARIR